MTKFLFKKGNKYGKGRTKGSLSDKEKKNISDRAKTMWDERKNELIEKVKIGMAKPEIRNKLSILNRRKRQKMSIEHRSKISDKLVGKEPKNIYQNFFASRNCHSKHDWLELGGKKYYMRSTWERNYARYLEWLKGLGEILDWEYEPKVFIFEKIKFGNRSYRPDFKVTEKDGKYIWHEIKGWMTPASRTKLFRMSHYFPDETIYVIDQQNYLTMASQLKNLIPNWEK